MSSMFAFPSMITQNAMPDHACSMTHHIDSMIACAWFNLKAQNPHEFLNHQTKYLERLTQSAVEVKVKGQGEGSGQLFCTICAQVALVLCEPLQVVALKTKVY